MAIYLAALAAVEADARPNQDEHNGHDEKALSGTGRDRDRVESLDTWHGPMMPAASLSPMSLVSRMTPLL